MNFRTVSTASVIVVISTVAATEYARGQHFDIFLARPAVNTQTVIGGADVDAQAFDDVTRVFEAELGELAGVFFALEPGVNHPNVNDLGVTYPASATALLSGDVLRLTERNLRVGGIAADLFYWNGVGPVAFTPAAADFRVEDADPLGTTAGIGGMFEYHPFLVVDDDSLPGVYLASVHGIVDGFAPSAPIYLVMGTEALITPEYLGLSQEEFDFLTEEEQDQLIDEALEAVIDPAVDWVEANLPVPEPSSLLLAVVGVVVAVNSRRERLRMPSV